MKTKSKRRHSMIGEWCHNFRSTIYQYSHSLGSFIYNQEHHELFGHDGKRWSKLAAFYFCLYISLGGLFCLYLAIFMSFLPLNQPRYIGKDSRLTSRSNPLSPGLSFRPQARFTLYNSLTLISLSVSNEIYSNKSIDDNSAIYTKSLDEYLKTYNNSQVSRNFTIRNVGDCNSNNYYGYKDGKPCILIKMNKLIGFIPEVGRTVIDNKHDIGCIGIANIPVRCIGEHIFDQEVLGDIVYYSESGLSDICGSIDIKHFPYNGQDNENDKYQVPYVWVQFKNITPYVLISVECRVFGANIFYHKTAQRGSIRFQLYLNKNI